MMAIFVYASLFVFYSVIIFKVLLCGSILWELVNSQPFCLM